MTSPSKKRRSSRTVTPAAAGSLRQLAAAIGVTGPAVRKWLDHPAWPFGRKAPFDIAEVRRWRAATLEPPRVAGQSEVTATPLTRARQLYTLERTLKVRQEREIEAGKFVLRTEVEATNRQRISAVKATMFAFARNACRDLAHQPANIIEDRLTQLFTDLCNHFADGIEQSDFTQTVKPTVAEHALQPQPVDCG